MGQDEADDEAGGGESYVVFQLDGEGYALEVGRVREVLDVSAITRVPGAAPALCGLYNLRGQVVPVWDLRAAFGLASVAPPVDHPASVLMVDPEPGAAASRVAGLRVDRVSDVLDSHPGEVRPAPAIGMGGGSGFIRGLIRHQERFLLLLDLDRVFAELGRPPELSLATDDAPAE